LGCRFMSSVVYIRFYAELNDFLPFEKRQLTFTHFFSGHPTVKDLIESLGIPHTEVDLILVNGRSVDFTHRAADGEQISVYPIFEALDISPLLQVRPEPLRESRFVLDTHLGKLASYLRMLGFDTLYHNSYTDQELAEISVNERRILLTRDRGLLKRAVVNHGYLVRSEKGHQQVAEVLHRFDLFNAIDPFTRCMQCNELLSKVSKAEVKGQVPAKVEQVCDQFSCCPACNRIYWKGSHFKKMNEFIDRLRAERL